VWVDGVQRLTDRVPYRFRPLSDNIVHSVREGDSLWNLAGLFYKGFARPSGLWWVIADFQPEPIFDPTIALMPGTILFAPSMRTVEERIFNEDRRREVEG
jgi:hypothetical protein